MKSRGFTLIETVVAIAILGVIVFGIYEAYRALYIAGMLALANQSALNLASERLEYGRGLTYASLNSLEPHQSATVNGRLFGIDTLVTNIDDPFDGLSPGDADPVDYKNIEVSVTCSNCRNFSTIRILGRFASSTP